MHLSAMALRKPRKSDASSIAAISIEVWIGTYLKRGVSAAFADFALNAFTSAKSEALISDPSQFVLVSENQEGIDGFIRVTSGSKAPIDGCSEMEISTLYVQPRHHGKGIGKQLLNAALQHCREKGIASVWLATNSENAPAIAFYLAQGFEHVGETHFRIHSDAYLNNVYCYRFV
jgi:ribosomal protein S18 acetylase RimI-like enzyme